MMKSKYFLLLIQVLVVLIIAYLVASGLKLLFGIPRPCELLETCPNSFSFPSSHTTIVFAAVGLISFYISNRFLKSALFGAAVIVGFWRFYSGVHTIQDVVGGAIIGMGVGILVYYIFKKYTSKDRRRR